MATAEHVRLDQARTSEVPWKAWGPYLAERQWGTVREDYSAGGDAWNYLTHDQARRGGGAGRGGGRGGVALRRRRRGGGRAAGGGGGPAAARGGGGGGGAG